MNKIEKINRFKWIFDFLSTILLIQKTDKIIDKNKAIPDDLNRKDLPKKYD